MKIELTQFKMKRRKINMNIIKALGTGIVAGAVFSSLKLPVPAPLALEGIAGILGITLGYLLVQKFVG